MTDLQLAASFCAAPFLALSITYAIGLAVLARSDAKAVRVRQERR